MALTIIRRGQDHQSRQGGHRYQEAVANFKRSKEFVKGPSRERPIIPVSANIRKHRQAIETIEKVIPIPRRTSRSRRGCRRAQLRHQHTRSEPER